MRMLPESYSCASAGGGRINRCEIAGAPDRRGGNDDGSHARNDHCRRERPFISARAKEKAILFIYPGYRFKAVDALVTNFHLPDSTPLFWPMPFILMRRSKRNRRFGLARTPTNKPSRKAIASILTGMRC